MKRPRFEDVSWHVLMRGAHRTPLFRDDADRAAFLRILEKSFASKKVALHAWVLMDTHYHLLVTAGSKTLGQAMQIVNRRLSRGTHAKYGLKGPLFDGPYLGFPMRSPFWKLRTARYLDFNPVQAGLVRRPEQYRWSSCRAVGHGARSPIALDPKSLLEAAGGRQSYRTFQPRASGRPYSRALRAVDVWAEHLAWLAEEAESRADALEGEAPRSVAVAWARQSGVPPRVISDFFGYASGHSVSVLLDSLRKRGEREPRLRKLLSLEMIR